MEQDPDGCRALFVQLADREEGTGPPWEFCGVRWSYQRRIAASTSTTAASGATATIDVQIRRIRWAMIAISSQ
jgi:hypothetical protein